MSYKVGKGLPEIETELDNPHLSSGLHEPEFRSISQLQGSGAKQRLSVPVLKLKIPRLQRVLQGEAENPRPSVPV